jgi:CRISPR-associated protein Csx17
MLRVVGEQADGGAALRWREGAAELRSELDRETLAAFLLDRYAPSPVLSPWNGGSGFFPKDDKAALEAIEASHSDRFDAWQDAVLVAREALAELALGEKPDAGDTKLALMRSLRARWSDIAIRWLDAAVVLLADGREFPPLLGSGGNDGRYDIANNFAHAVVLALSLDGDRDGRARAWLDSALDGGSVPLVVMSLAHLDRQKSPVNAPDGEADGMANPWDLVLAVEGALALAAGAARRGSGASGTASAPFTVSRTAAGYGSAVAGENGRAEIWLPLWARWTTLPELETVLREGRAQVGRTSASSGLEFARAAAELGVARGISAFERYAVLERAGQSNLALPAGRIEVRSRPEVRLLHQVERWTRRVTGLTGDAPASIRSAGRALEDALFAFAREPGAVSGQRLTVRIGETEAALARSASTAGGGPRPLSGGPVQGWLDVADDGSPEFTLAAALASLRDRGSTHDLPALRDYLHGTALTSTGRTYDPSRKATIPRSAPPIRRLAAVLVRRHLDAASLGAPLGFSAALSCPRAVAALLAAEDPAIDPRRVLALAGGLCLFDFSAVSWRPSWMSAEPPEPNAAHALLALAFQGTREHPLTPRPGWAALLSGGHVRRALAEATLRLRVAELPPVPTAEDLAPGAPAGAALAAALLLHFSAGDRAVLARRLLNLPVPNVQGATL